MSRTECLKRLHMLQMTQEALGSAENVQALQMAIEVLERIHEAREAAEKAKEAT